MQRRTLRPQLMSSCGHSKSLQAPQKRPQLSWGIRRLCRRGPSSYIRLEIAALCEWYVAVHKDLYVCRVERGNPMGSSTCGNVSENDRSSVGCCARAAWC